MADPLKAPRSTDAVVSQYRELEDIAKATLRIGRLLMASGARAQVVHEGCAIAARGMGAEMVEVWSGYAVIGITIGSGASAITRMTEVGPHGVNHRLDEGLRRLVRRIQRRDVTLTKASVEIGCVERTVSRHNPWLVAPAVGIACAAFGRLLGVDWAAFIPVAAAGAIGQAVRQVMMRSGVNIFVVAAAIAFLSSSLGGLGASWAGSTTVELAMIASVLLLVPGVPALNAQSDIIEGHPTLGSARVVSVSMLLIFIGTGILMTRALLGVRP